MLELVGLSLASRASDVRSNRSCYGRLVTGFLFIAIVLGIPQTETPAVDVARAGPLLDLPSESFSRHTDCDLSLAFR
jgi:hypothetical protein